MKIVIHFDIIDLNMAYTYLNRSLKLWSCSVKKNIELFGTRALTRMNDCSYENMRFKITTYDLHSKQTLSMPAINCLAQQGMKIVCFFFFFFDFAINS